jgi:hypothetical protein
MYLVHQNPLLSHLPHFPSPQVCKAAPVPGETKVWQYITLMKRIFLIDCPGVVYHKSADSDSDAVLKGVVRVEGLEDATGHVAAVLDRVKPEYLVSLGHLCKHTWCVVFCFVCQVSELCGCGRGCVGGFEGGGAGALGAQSWVYPLHCHALYQDLLALQGTLHVWSVQQAVGAGTRNGSAVCTWHAAGWALVMMNNQM